MHRHIGMRPHRKDLVLSKPQLLDSYVYCHFSLHQMFLQLSERLAELAEHNKRG